MKTHPPVRFFIAVFLGFLTLASVTAAKGAKYDALYTFGDSLADNGNDFILTTIVGLTPAITPSVTPHKTYFKGRFSNGFVAFEYLWEFISGNAPGTRKSLKPFLEYPILRQNDAVNFAFGGTGTPFIDQTPGGFFAPGLKGQVALFRGALGSGKPSKRALYAIVTGINDYRVGQFNVPMSPSDVVRNIVDAITSLYVLGARHIVVTNLPNLAVIPANAGNQEAASQVSIAHNHALEAALGVLPNRLPEIDLIYVDLDDVLTRLPSGMNMTIPALDTFPPAPPSRPGVPPVPRSLCLFIDPSTCTDVPTFDVGDQFAFWDVVHPTTAVHRVFGRYVYDLLLNRR